MSQSFHLIIFVDELLFYLSLLSPLQHLVNILIPLLFLSASTLTQLIQLNHNPLPMSLLKYITIILVIIIIVIVPKWRLWIMRGISVTIALNKGIWGQWGIHIHFGRGTVWLQRHYILILCNLALFTLLSYSYISTTLTMFKESNIIQSLYLMI